MQHDFPAHCCPGAQVFDTAGRVALCKELQGHTQQCVRDQNGNHVIQKVGGAPPSGLHER